MLSFLFRLHSMSVQITKPVLSPVPQDADEFA
jgi:hypothetical protein